MSYIKFFFAQFTKNTFWTLCEKKISKKAKIRKNNDIFDNQLCQTAVFDAFLWFFEKIWAKIFYDFWLNKTRRITWICQFLVKIKKKFHIIPQSSCFSFFRFWKGLLEKKKWPLHFVKFFVLKTLKKNSGRLDVYSKSCFDFNV